MHFSLRNDSLALSNNSTYFLFCCKFLGAIVVLAMSRFCHCNFDSYAFPFYSNFITNGKSGCSRIAITKQELFRFISAFSMCFIRFSLDSFLVFPFIISQFILVLLVPTQWIVQFNFEVEEFDWKFNDILNKWADP